MSSPNNKTDKSVSPLKNFGGKTIPREDKRFTKKSKSVQFPISIPFDLLTLCLNHPHGDRSNTISHYIKAGLVAEGIEVAQQ
jgi:hypothetical protein